MLNSLNEYSLIIMELNYRGFGAYLLEADGTKMTSEFCPHLVSGGRDNYTQRHK